MIKTILIDPPWKLCSGGKPSLSIQAHYPVQSQKEIISTCKEWISKYQISSEAHIYIWSVNTYSGAYSKGIEDALELCRTLGFKPITNLLWVKSQGNPTPYGLRASELCIFGSRHRKGEHKKVMYKGINTDDTVALPSLVKSRDWMHSERREHSRKPDNFYSLIESRSNGPYLELYGRTKREGWTTEGNDTNKFKVKK